MGSAGESRRGVQRYFARFRFLAPTDMLVARPIIDDDIADPKRGEFSDTDVGLQQRLRRYMQKLKK